MSAAPSKDIDTVKTDYSKPLIHTATLISKKFNDIQQSFKSSLKNRKEKIAKRIHDLKDTLGSSSQIQALISVGKAPDIAIRKQLNEANKQCSVAANKLLNRCNIANSQDFNRLNRSIADLASRIELLANRQGIKDLVLERRKHDRRSSLEEPRYSSKHSSKHSSKQYDNRLYERRRSADKAI